MLMYLAGQPNPLASTIPLTNQKPIEPCDPPPAPTGPLCPGCGDVSADDRQEKAPNRCRWCGYDHETGTPVQLVAPGCSLCGGSGRQVGRVYGTTEPCWNGCGEERA